MWVLTVDIANQRPSPLAAHVYATDPEIVTCLLGLVSLSCQEICLFSYLGKIVVYLLVFESNHCRLHKNCCGVTFVTFRRFLVCWHISEIARFVFRCARPMTSPSAHVRRVTIRNYRQGGKHFQSLKVNHRSFHGTPCVPQMHVCLPLRPSSISLHMML